MAHKSIKEFVFKMKKIIWTGMISYLIAFCIIISLFLAMIGLMLFGFLSGFWINGVNAWICFVISVGSSVFMFIVMGYLAFQYVVADEEKIYSKNLFGKMRELKWEEIKEIRIDNVIYDPRLSPLTWMIFIEKGDPERTYRGGGMTKKSCIKIRYSSENEAFFKQYFPNIPINNVLEMYE